MTQFMVPREWSRLPRNREMGRAEQIFARIRDGGGAAEIQNMVEANVVEELFLDYKRSSTLLPSPRLSEDDRKNLAKAISGFANSEGGLIIWGVDCRPTPDGDVPVAAVPITQVTALKTLFDSALGGLTLPSHSGVENLAVPMNAAGGGFVITYVPVGLHVPYQCLYPRREYYIRAGSNFLPTPHGVLAGMFGRAPQPSVAPVISFQSVSLMSSPPPTIRVALIVGIVNGGRGFAEDIFCYVEAQLPERCAANYVPGGLPARHWKTLSGGSERYTFMAIDLKLPPGAEQQLFEIQLSIDAPPQDDANFSVSAGSRGGPGAGKEIGFPVALIRDIHAFYSAPPGDVPSRRAGDYRYASLIKERLG
jgi:hypothetical protein